jgi:amidase
VDEIDLSWASIAECRTLLNLNRVSSLELVHHAMGRIDRIDRSGPTLRSVIEVNPDAESIASTLDDERHAGTKRGPLHGIPILIKDNIDTADSMQTTAGSLALVGAPHQQDATVAALLRRAGAVILGKTNLSEWANFRSTHSTSGWSARGGQTRNPYALDRSPCGSSSGSGAAVAAGITVASLGTETDGSILCPASSCGLVGIKPTVGLTSRAGVIPISHTQDTIGPLARTVADAALLLSAIARPDDRDPSTHTSERPDLQHLPAFPDAFLNAHALRGARLGVPRTLLTGYNKRADEVAEAAIDLMRECGAIIVDPADLPSATEIKLSHSELQVLLYEFKANLNAYLAGLGEGAPVRSLEELIAFNTAHATDEMPYFGQELLEMAQAKGSLSESEYVSALAEDFRLGRTEGIDAVMNEHNLDALVMPTGGPPFLIDLVNGDAHDGGGSSGPAAIAGYPAITVPAGHAFGLPIGITFIGRAWSEPTLIRLAYAFEQASHAWRPPQFLPTVP